MADEALPGELHSVNIRPRVTILSVLRHLNYKPWFALAEFVDNAIQSYLDYKAELRDLHGPEFKLRVALEWDPSAGGRLVIRDNAAGIHEKDYPRAFRAAEIPLDQSGLSEFGMGMKSAACWFAKTWTVRSGAFGEQVERSVTFDIAKIVREHREEVDIVTRTKKPTDHYTEIVLANLYKPLRGSTLPKIREHLASIFRVFVRDGELDLTFDGEPLTYISPAILTAPYFKDSDVTLLWEKPIDLVFEDGKRLSGFAALRERGSTAEAGFALFRRNRLIQGSADEGYRPQEIFGSSNSFTYQRLFGELNLDGFDVTHTKDGFQWEDDEEAVLATLKGALDSEPLRLLSQAEGYRTRVRPQDVVAPAQIAVDATAAALERESSAVITQQVIETIGDDATLAALPPAGGTASRTIDVTVGEDKWRISIELVVDPAIGEWLSLADQPTRAGSGTIRELGIRMNLAHPFMERFRPIFPTELEGVLRIGTALVLAEVIAREQGVTFAGVIRKHVNELLREALSKP